MNSLGFLLPTAFSLVATFVLLRRDRAAASLRIGLIVALGVVIAVTVVDGLRPAVGSLEDLAPQIFARPHGF